MTRSRSFWVLVGSVVAVARQIFLCQKRRWFFFHHSPGIQDVLQSCRIKCTTERTIWYDFYDVLLTFSTSNENESQRHARCFLRVLIGLVGVPRDTTTEESVQFRPRIDSDSFLLIVQIQRCQRFCDFWTFAGFCLLSVEIGVNLVKWRN